MTLGWEVERLSLIITTRVPLSIEPPLVIRRGRPLHLFFAQIGELNKVKICSKI